MGRLYFTSSLLLTSPLRTAPSFGGIEKSAIGTLGRSVSANSRCWAPKASLPQRHHSTRAATVSSCYANKKSAVMLSTAASQDEIRSKKQALRKDVRKKLKSLSRKEIEEQSQQVWDRLVDIPTFQKAKSVGLFLSMPVGEINTDGALRIVMESDKSIYVPRVGENFENADMELLRVQTTADAPSAKKRELFHLSWPRNKWGIPEPPPDALLEQAQPGDIDVMIIPGLAFDSSGNRLGQGKGYYDRFLARMNKCDNPPLLIAVALDCQLVLDGQIPVNEHDFPVQWILLPNKEIEVHR